MKKLMFTFAVLAMASSSALAQPDDSSHNLEVSFNPVSSSLFSTNSIIDASTFKYRKWLSEDRALRVTLGLNQMSNSYLVVPENSLQEAGATGTLTHPDLFLNNDMSGFDIGIGYEIHLNAESDKLSPYFGFAAGMSSNSLTLTRERFSALNLDGSTVNAGFWEDEPDPANWGVWSYSNEIKSSTINLDLLFGADYYFDESLYIGFEAGIRYAQTSGITSTITASDNNAFNIYFDGGQGDENSSSLVQNTVTGGSGFQWNSATEVNYVINGEPWLGDGVSSTNPLGGPADQAAYIAADALWNDWAEQSPATQDALLDSPRDAFFSGSNFLGTYTTGMLRIGYLFSN
jgi:hypothetical protein